MHRHPDLAIGREGQVGLLDLGGQRGEGELPRAEVPFGPELALPSPFGVLPVANHEVLLGVLRHDIGEGLEAQAHPRLKPKVLEERVLVAEELGPTLFFPHLLRSGIPVGAS